MIWWKLRYFITRMDRTRQIIFQGISLNCLTLKNWKKISNFSIREFLLGTGEICQGETILNLKDWNSGIVWCCRNLNENNQTSKYSLYGIPVIGWIRIQHQSAEYAPTIWLFKKSLRIHLDHPLFTGNVRKSTNTQRGYICFWSQSNLIKWNLDRLLI